MKTNNVEYAKKYYNEKGLPELGCTDQFSNGCYAINFFAFLINNVNKLDPDDTLLEISKEARKKYVKTTPKKETSNTIFVSQKQVKANKIEFYQKLNFCLEYAKQNGKLPDYSISFPKEVLNAHQKPYTFWHNLKYANTSPMKYDAYREDAMKQLSPYFRNGKYDKIKRNITVIEVKDVIPEEEKFYAKLDFCIKYAQTTGKLPTTDVYFPKELVGKDNLIAYNFWHSFMNSKYLAEKNTKYRDIAIKELSPYYKKKIK